MESLNNRVKTAKANDWLEGFDVAREGRESLEVTHLQYADDTLIFRDAVKEQVKFFRVILVFIRDIRTPHQQEEKHSIFINEVVNMEVLNAILGSEIGSLRTTYLGMPLEDKFKSSEVWNNVHEKCKEIGQMEESVYVLGREINTSIQSYMPCQHI